MLQIVHFHQFDHQLKIKKKKKINSIKRIEFFLEETSTIKTSLGLSHTHNREQRDETTKVESRGFIYEVFILLYTGFMHYVCFSFRFVTSDYPLVKTGQATPYTHQFSRPSKFRAINFGAPYKFINSRRNNLWARGENL